MSETDLLKYGENLTEDQDHSEEAQDEVVILECKGKFLIRDTSDSNLTETTGVVKLRKECFTIELQLDQVLSFTFREVAQVISADYRMQIELDSAQTITILELGYRYEDFLRDFYGLWNEIIIKDLLMREKLCYPIVHGQFVYANETGGKNGPCSCEIRLYETALVAVPLAGEFIRIPYSDIKNVEANDYRITITGDYGETLVFSMLGKQYDPFIRDLKIIRSGLAAKAEFFISEVLPGGEPSEIRRLTSIVKEGKAVAKSAIEAIQPRFWTGLEQRLETAGIKEEYQYLKEFSIPDRICIGFKRGLWGDLSGDYLWFLIPIYSLNPAEPGNIVAMEAVSAEGQGRATYFFKIVNRSEYRNFTNIEQLEAKADQFLQRMNRCLSAVNFRREPIYLSADELLKPEYIKYRLAIKKLPALQSLRESFVGRVNHNRFEQWTEDVTDLLKFNVSTDDEQAKWSKHQQ